MSEYDVIATCPECKNKIALDKTGNCNEEYIQCTNTKCTQIFKNKYFLGEQNETKPSYCQ